MLQNLRLLPVLLALFPSALGRNITYENLWRDGAAHVQGQLLCNGTAYAGQTVELWKKQYLGPDQLLISAKTSETGVFDLKASSTELYYDPRIYFYVADYCNPTSNFVWMNCGRTIKIYIPPPLVTEGNIPKQTFDVGNLEMSTVQTELRGFEAVAFSLIAHKRCRGPNG